MDQLTRTFNDDEIPMSPPHPPNHRTVLCRNSPCKSLCLSFYYFIIGFLFGILTPLLGVSAAARAVARFGNQTRTIKILEYCGTNVNLVNSLHRKRRKSVKKNRSVKNSGSCSGKGGGTGVVIREADGCSLKKEEKAEPSSKEC